MKTERAESGSERGKPVDTVKVGNFSVSIYRHTNIIPERNTAGKIICDPPRSPAASGG